MITYQYFEFTDPQPLLLSLQERVSVFSDVAQYLRETKGEVSFHRWHVIEERGKVTEVGSLCPDYPLMEESPWGFKLATKDFSVLSRFVKSPILPLLQFLRETYELPSLPRGVEVWCKDDRAFLTLPTPVVVEERLEETPLIRSLSFQDFWTVS